MYEILNSFKQNPAQNFNKHSSILETPKIFKIPQNLVFREWNAWKWGIRDIPSEEELD